MAGAERKHLLAGAAIVGAVAIGVVLITESSAPLGLPHDQPTPKEVGAAGSAPSGSALSELASKPGPAPPRRPGVVAVPKNPSLGSIQHVGSNAGGLYCLVTLDGVPQAGAQVLLSVPRSPHSARHDYKIRTVTTNANGIAQLPELPARTAWDIGLSLTPGKRRWSFAQTWGRASPGPSSFVWWNGSIWVEERGCVSTRDAKPASLLLHLATFSPVVVSGRVVVEATRDPVPGAVLHYLRREFRADEHGRFQLRLDPGDLGNVLWAEAEGLGVSGTHVGDRAPPKSRSLEVTLRLPVGYGLEGKVIDATGAPLKAKVKVTARVHDQSGTGDFSVERTLLSDSQGRFQAHGFPLGSSTEGGNGGSGFVRVAVSASCEGYREAETTCVVRPGQRGSVTLRLKRLLTLTGRVVGTSGDPLAGVMLFVYEPDQAFQTELVRGLLMGRKPERARRRTLATAISGATGEFQVPELLPGQLHVLAYRRDLPVHQFLLGSTRGVLLTLTKSTGRIAGRLTDSEGAPATWSVVEARIAGEEPWTDFQTVPSNKAVWKGVLDTGTVQEDGSFRLEHLPPVPAFDLFVQHHRIARGVAPGTHGLVLKEPREPRDDTILKGSPVDARTGKAIEGTFHVFVHDAKGQLIDTRHQTGDLMAFLPSAGPVRLTVWANGYLPTVKPAVAELGKEVELGTIRLQKGGGSIKLSFRRPDEFPADLVYVEYREPKFDVPRSQLSFPPPATKPWIGRIESITPGVVELRVTVEAEGWSSKRYSLPPLKVRVRNGQEHLLAIDLGKAKPVSDER